MAPRAVIGPAFRIEELFLCKWEQSAKFHRRIELRERMRRLALQSESYELDRSAVRAGIEESALIEAAGRKSALKLLEIFSSRLTFVAPGTMAAMA